MPIYSPKSSGGPEDIVRYGKQFLTAEQKAQALDNIGAGSGVPSSGPAIAWRIRQLVSNNANACSIAELQFRGVLGGPTLCVGGNAIASSMFLLSSGVFYPSFAFDGGASDWWNSDNLEPNPTLGYLFATPVDVVQVMLQAVSVGGVNAPRDFQIQKSYDGVRWITVSTVLNQTGWTGSEIRTYNF